MQSKMTIHDLPAEHPEGKLIELINGEAHERRSETFTHQTVLGNLAITLHKHSSEKRTRDIVAIGPLDVVLDHQNILQPDILLIHANHENIIRDGRIMGAPDLCIEITSASSFQRDTTTKREIYARCKVREYWIVDPDAKSVTVYQLSIDATNPFAQLTESDWLTSVQLPDFKLAISELFQR